MEIRGKTIKYPTLAIKLQKLGKKQKNDLETFVWGGGTITSILLH